jgi:hypothetical protein
MSVITTAGVNTNLTTDLSGALAAGDELIIGRGNVAYAAGANLSGTDLLSVYIGPGYQGSPSATFQFTCNRTSTGQLFVNFGGQTLTIASSGVAGVIYKIHHEPWADGRVTYESMDCEVFKATRGTAALESTADINYITAQGSSRVLAVNAAYTVARAETAENGYLEIDRDCTYIYHGSQPGGVGLVVTSPNVTPANLEVAAACEADYRGGDIGNYIAHPGSILNLVNCDRKLTVTDLQKLGDIFIKIKRNGPGLPTFSGTSVNRGSTITIEVD